MIQCPQYEGRVNDYLFLKYQILFRAQDVFNNDKHWGIDVNLFSKRRNENQKALSVR